MAPISTSHKSTPIDEIYIDDEQIEGSGGGGEVNIYLLILISVKNI